MGNCSSDAGVATDKRSTRSLAIYAEHSPFPVSLSGTVEACRGGTVLLSGCGGGYDVVGTSPLLYHLQNVASDIILTNLTVTDPSLLEEFGEAVSGCDKRRVRRIRPGVFYHRLNYNPYFPEALFANAVKRPVYAISQGVTVAELSEIYKKILSAHKCKRVRAIFLAKGGSDVLFTGDESGNAIPAVDMLHLRSVLTVPAEHRSILSLGFDLLGGRDVDPSDVDDRLNQLRKSGAVLFEELLSMDREDAKFYRETVDKCDPGKTVVQSLVSAAIKGQRGLYTPEVLVPRIGKNVSELTDRTATLFGFDMDGVANGIKYLHRLPASADVEVVRSAIRGYKAESRRRLKPIGNSGSMHDDDTMKPEEAPQQPEQAALAA